MSPRSTHGKPWPVEVFHRLAGAGLLEDQDDLRPGERPIHGKPPDGNMPEGSTSEDSTQTTRAASSPCSIHCAVHEESDTAIGREYWNLHSIGGQQICRSGRACSPSGQSLGEIGRAHV